MNAQKYLGDYIKGNFEPVTDSQGEIESRNPSDLDQTPFVVPYHYERINEAVEAAKLSFRSWTKLPVEDRLKFVEKYRDAFKKEGEALARMISWEVGKPLWESLNDIEEAIDVMDFHLGQTFESSQKVDLKYNNLSATVRRSAQGVCAVVSPAVQPVPTPISYIVPALIAGNVVVLKSSQHSPMTAQMLAEIAHNCGLPSGVLNLIHGNSETARRLIAHKDVNAFFYTGPYENAVKVQKQILNQLWKVGIYNTGGKNAAIIWEDATYEKALYETLFGAFVSSGQRCYATSRVLLHDSIFDKFLSDFHTLSKKCRVGDGLDENNMPFMGPLVSNAGVENYLRFQGMAVREGCEEVMRGKQLERDKKGFFVSPSIHFVSNADPKSLYQNEDNSGPNVAFYRISDLEQALDIADQTNYGLATSIYTNTQSHYEHLASNLRTGHCNWNLPTTVISRKLPIGGAKLSGNLRPLGSTAYNHLSFPCASIEATSQSTWEKVPGSIPTLHS